MNILGRKIDWKDEDDVREFRCKYRHLHANDLRQYRIAHREEYNVKKRRAYWSHRAQLVERSRKNRRKMKHDVLAHYSGGEPRCACCGEKTIEFLSIDHVHGGGKKHFKKLGRIGTPFYQWLKLKNYPKGYGVLCLNCNFAKGHYGKCPHQNGASQ